MRWAGYTLEYNLCTRVDYAFLCFSHPLLEGKGLALSKQVLVETAVHVQAPLLLVFSDGLAGIPSGERVVVVVAEKATGGAIEDRVTGEEDDKERIVDKSVEDNA